MMQRTKGPWAWRNFGGKWMLMGEWGRRPVVLATQGAKSALLVRDENGTLVDLTPDHPDAKALAMVPDLIEISTAAYYALRSYQYHNSATGAGRGDRRPSGGRFSGSRRNACHTLHRDE